MQWAAFVCYSKCDMTELQFSHITFAITNKCRPLHFFSFVSFVYRAFFPLFRPGPRKSLTRP